jgi:hypothetical protein
VCAHAMKRAMRWRLGRRSRSVFGFRIQGIRHDGPAPALLLPLRVLHRCAVADAQGCALYLDKLTILDPSRASSAMIRADQHVYGHVKEPQGAGVLQTVTPAEVLAKYAPRSSEAIRHEMTDREFLDLCDATGDARWTLAFARVPRKIQTVRSLGISWGTVPARSRRNRDSTVSRQG